MYKKIKWPVYLFGVLLAILLFSSSQNHDNNKSFQKQINNILPANTSDFDFEKIVLNLNEVFDPKFDKKWTQNELNTITKSMKEYINNEADPELIMKKFNDYFFVNQGFIFDTKANSLFSSGNFSEKISVDDFLNFQSIERVLKRKQGICLSLSVLYLIIADKLKIPVYGVIIPGHIFVRYQDKNHSGINSETTFGGAEFYGYKDMTGTQFVDNKNTLYNKCLDNYTVLAALLNNFSIMYMNNLKDKKAEFLLKKSIEMAPGFPEPYNGLGVIYEASGNIDMAIKEFETSLSLFPDDSQINLRLGLLYKREKRYTLAEKYLTIASKYDDTKFTAIEALDNINKN